MHLVLGTPDPVARCLIARLVRQGETVATFGGPELKGLLPSEVELIDGDAASIDFGLSGADYLRLAERVTSLTLAEGALVRSGDVEKSRAVRQAVEVGEFVAAGGARGGVRFLSSLLVFGNASGAVSEDEFEVGQSFRDETEEALAVAEKLIRRVARMCEVAIVRVAPVVGSEESGELIADSALAQIARELEGAGEDKTYPFSDLPVRFETVERATSALLSAQPARPAQILHLVDEEPLLDRQLLDWLAHRLGKNIFESPPGARPFALWAKGSTPGYRAVAGWGLRFERGQAEGQLSHLIDRDDWGVLEKLFPRSEDPA